MMNYKGIDKEKILEVQKVKLLNTDAYAIFTEEEVKEICKGTDSCERLYKGIENQLKARINDTEMAIICEMAMMYLDSLKGKEADKEAYNKGLNDAWELARKIVLPESEGGMKIDELKNVFKNHSYFDINDILKRYTAQETLSKLEAYEKEQAEIKVGDVVYNDDTMEEGIVTYIKNDEIFMLYDDGSCGIAKGNLTKTGKHIDIQKILDKLKEGTE